MATQWKSFALIFAVSIIAGLLSKIYQKLNLYGKPLHLFTKRVDSLVCIFLIVEIVWLHFRDFSILNYLFGI